MHPSTNLSPKGQIIAQIITTRGPSNTSTVPVAYPVQAITEERPRVTSAGQAIIHHYMDDVLVCAPTDDELTHALDLTIDALIAAGFELQEEKVQRMPPWKYLVLEISKRTIVLQKLAIKQSRQKYIHVSIDTFSGAVFASAHTGEKVGDVIKHLIHAFSFLGIPKELKTDNGLVYKSRELCSFLQQWGVEHKTGIPHSPTGQAMVERTHGTIKRVLHQQQRVLKVETPAVRLARSFFTINFLNCYFEGLNLPIIRHFGASSLFSIRERPPVMVRDPESGRMEGPHDLVTWGRGYACVVHPHGTKVDSIQVVNHIIASTEESPEKEGLELEEVLEGAPEDDGRDPDEKEHGLGYPTQHHLFAESYPASEYLPPPFQSHSS
ncbi:hypothetical protein DUI87_22244 [Hirundo rustica rustica]|uniref:ribonuclease H n=1 Tax=Hirundo rustica rustica TaxID=333673 RepID=A0A3M0JJQ7_HIRRU|nr:hypothetical protein DUI87_22244 [Hirundo rustica rustica]